MNVSFCDKINCAWTVTRNIGSIYFLIPLKKKKLSRLQNGNSELNPSFNRVLS